VVVQQHLDLFHVVAAVQVDLVGQVARVAAVVVAVVLLVELEILHKLILHKVLVEGLVYQEFLQFQLILQ
jgi:hypothetical protein